MHDEVIRGLRWGAILVAALAIAIAGYRIAREAPPAQAAPAPESNPVVSRKDVPAAPALPPTTPVPAPPPIRKFGHAVARNVERSVAPQPAPIAIPVAETRVVDEPLPAVDLQPQEPAVFVPRPHAVPIAAAKDPDPLPDSRGRRWLKAVGRWVHVVVKNN